VPAPKGKTRVFLVLEKKGLPLEAARGMTSVAAILELAEMDVRVAGDAGCRKRLETHSLSVSTWKLTFLQGMALSAGYRAVLSGQREARLPVFERRLPKALDRVAARAISVLKLAQMGIVFMAIAAAGE
jgi:hypothetical protein